jgi:hypothetical protein
MLGELGVDGRRRLKCRLHRSVIGATGVPPQNWIIAALERVRQEPGMARQRETGGREDAPAMSLVRPSDLHRYDEADVARILR